MELVETTTKDGLILHGLISEPKRRGSAIINIHGMAGNFFRRGYISQMLDSCPKKSITFLSAEVRGAEMVKNFNKKDGTWARIGNSYEVFEECIYDIDAWIKFLRKIGYKEVYLLGHSLGASKVAYYLVQNKNLKVSGAIFLSPSDMLGCVLEGPDYEDHKRSYKEAKELIAKGKGKTLLSKDLWNSYWLSANTYINFYSSNSNAAIFNFYKPKLGFSAVSKINVPILAITGTEDDGIVTDKYESMKILKEKAINCPRFRSVILKGAKHQFDGFEGKLVDAVIKFVTWRGPEEI